MSTVAARASWNTRTEKIWKRRFEDWMTRSLEIPLTRASFVYGPPVAAEEEEVEEGEKIAEIVTGIWIEDDATSRTHVTHAMHGLLRWAVDPAHDPRIERQLARDPRAAPGLDPRIEDVMEGTISATATATAMVMIAEITIEAPMIETES
jgi:hypothetical protein